MEAPGSMGMMYWGRLFRSRRWFDLTPDQNHKVVTDGVGESWGSDYLAAARTSDRSTVIAYMPTARTVTVDMTKLPKGEAVALWFDPRYGQSAARGDVRPKTCESLLRLLMASGCLFWMMRQINRSRRGNNLMSMLLTAEMSPLPL